MKKLAVLCLALVMLMSIALTANAEPATYTVAFDSLTEWDYCFVAVNAFGDEAGVGMVNLDNWGMKKLKLDENGNLAGTGLSYTLNLTVDGEAYTLDLIAHIIGAGSDYMGEGDLTYRFQGACSDVEGGYKLEQPTYVLVTVDGDITCSDVQKGDDAFSMSVPESGFSVDSDGNGEDGNKIIGSKLVDTVFGGATFFVEGSEIVSIDDIEWL
ncbi:MAG: hypothetical protein Q4G52_10185 [Clostridia bacterium]|nr:hypothetical protein [Clostridia bacterium]